MRAYRTKRPVNIVVTYAGFWINPVIQNIAGNSVLRRGLFFLVGHAIGEGRRNQQATTGSSSNSSFSSCLSGNLPPKKNRDFRTIEFVGSKDAANRSNDTSGLSSSLQTHQHPKA